MSSTTNQHQPSDSSTLQPTDSFHNSHLPSTAHIFSDRVTSYTALLQQGLDRFCLGIAENEMSLHLELVKSVPFIPFYIDIRNGALESNGRRLADFYDPRFDGADGKAAMLALEKGLLSSGHSVGVLVSPDPGTGRHYMTVYFLDSEGQRVQAMAIEFVGTNSQFFNFVAVITKTNATEIDPQKPILLDGLELTPDRILQACYVAYQDGQILEAASRLLEAYKQINSIENFRSEYDAEIKSLAQSYYALLENLKPQELLAFIEQYVGCRLEVSHIRDPEIASPEAIFRKLKQYLDTNRKFQHELQFAEFSEFSSDYIKPQTTEYNSSSVRPQNDNIQSQGNVGQETAGSARQLGGSFALNFAGTATLLPMGPVGFSEKRARQHDQHDDQLVIGSQGPRLKSSNFTAKTSDDQTAQPLKTPAVTATVNQRWQAYMDGALGFWRTHPFTAQFKPPMVIKPNREGETASTISLEVSTHPLSGFCIRVEQSINAAHLESQQHVHSSVISNAHLNNELLAIKVNESNNQALKSNLVNKDSQSELILAQTEKTWGELAIDLNQAHTQAELKVAQHLTTAVEQATENQSHGQLRAEHSDQALKEKLPVIASDIPSVQLAAQIQTAARNERVPEVQIEMKQQVVVGNPTFESQHTAQPLSSSSEPEAYNNSRAKKVRQVRNRSKMQMHMKKLAALAKLKHQAESTAFDFDLFMKQFAKLRKHKLYIEVLIFSLITELGLPELEQITLFNQLKLDSSVLAEVQDIRVALKKALQENSQSHSSQPPTRNAAYFAPGALGVEHSNDGVPKEIQSNA